MTTKLNDHHDSVCALLSTKFQLLTPFIFSRAAAHRRGGSQKKSHIIHCLYCSQASTQTFELVKDSCRGQQLHA